MSLWRRTAAFIACLTLLAACGHQSPSLVPPGARGTIPQQPGALPPAVHNRFAEATNKLLRRDEDFDQFISASVVGHDRIVARSLMRLMPQGQRGDFIYAEPTGRVISNNADLVKEAKFERHPPTPIESGTTISSTPNRASNSGARHVKDYFGGNCAPPHPYRGTGPYVRQVSQCGLSAGWAFVNLECNSTHMDTDNDAGHAYFEIWSQAGSASEGGIFTKHGDYDINPYMRVSDAPNSGYVTLNNANMRYACNNTLAIWHGVTRASFASSPLVFTEVGNLPSSYDPTQVFLYSEIVTLQGAAWLFYAAPYGMNSPGNDPFNQSTPCHTCTVSKVTSIARNNNQSLSGHSYFGINPQNYYAMHWIDVLYGTWEDGCQQGASVCYFGYSRDFGRAYGGPQYYPDDHTADVDFSRWGAPYEAYDAVSLDRDLQGNSIARHPLSDFRALPPPSCTPDAYGYCVAYDSGLSGGQIQGLDNWGMNCGYYPMPMGAKESYLIMTGSTQLEKSFSSTWVDDGTGSCTTVLQWSTADPAQVYNDPNLP